MEVIALKLSHASRKSPRSADQHAHQQVVCQGQCADHITHHQRDTQHGDTGQSKVNRRLIFKLDCLPPRARGSRSSVNAVEAASKPALAVDIIAASSGDHQAADTVGQRGFDDGGERIALIFVQVRISTWAAILISAQARP